MTYTWRDFNLFDAMYGTLVGLPSSGHIPSQGQTSTEDIDDISKVAGTLTELKEYNCYKVVINGNTAILDSEGKVTSSIPSTAFTANTQMYLASTTIVETVGNVVTRSGEAETGYNQEAVLANMEPRDTFAIQILSSMLVHAGNPESFDDASIMLYSRAAYRWAQGMMNAAANTRHGESTSPSTDVDINSGDLQSNTEKLLYNIGEYIKNGIVVKGTTAVGTVPVQTKVTEVTEVKKITEITDLATTNTRLATIGTELDYIEGDLENIDTHIQNFYDIPSHGNINIVTSIFKQMYIRFEVQSYMAYSDISVYMELAVKEGETATTRKVGFVIPRGSVVTLNPLDNAVTEITSITTKTVRGKGSNDPNTYALTNPA